MPKLYEEYCTDNIIVMEFVEVPTINKLPLTRQNKAKVAKALNSYFKSSFWALFNGETIVFHGDPHSGNVCVDDDGCLWFLDMGLLCILDQNDAQLCLDFFLAAYSGNYESLYNQLIPYANMDERKQQKFKRDCREYCANIHSKEVTWYFIDMVNICLSYELVPPDFLFHMAKAFVCLNGISNFTGNQCAAHDLLAEQIIEFLVKRSLDDCQQIAKSGLNLIPNTITNIMGQGITSAIAQLIVNHDFKQNLGNSLDHLRETFDLLAVSLHDHRPS